MLIGWRRTQRATVCKAVRASSQSIVQTAVSTPGFSILAEAVTNAGLADALSAVRCRKAVAASVLPFRPLSNKPNPPDGVRSVCQAVARVSALPPTIEMRMTTPLGQPAPLSPAATTPPQPVKLSLLEHACVLLRPALTLGNGRATDVMNAGRIAHGSMAVR